MTISTPWWIQTIIGELSETQNQELTAEFLHQEDILDKICSEIQNQFGFDLKRRPCLWVSLSRGGNEKSGRSGRFHSV